MMDVLQFEFMQNALLAGILVSIICGVIGTFVVVNRIVFLAGGIAHAAYGGIGLAFFFGFSYMVGTLGFSLAAAVIMAAVTLKSRQRSDTMIGVLWAVGMALGVLLLDLTPGYNVDLMSYLFGSILTVPRSDLGLIAVLSAAILLIIWYFYYDLLAMSYDQEFAMVRKVPVKLLYFLLIAMIAVAVVMTIRVVGLILVIALMTIPPYIAEKYARSLGIMMILSAFLSTLFTLSGLWLSYIWNLTSGATIIMVSAGGFFLSIVLEHFKSNNQKKTAHHPKSSDS